MEKIKNINNKMIVISIICMFFVSIFMPNIVGNNTIDIDISNEEFI